MIHNVRKYMRLAKIQISLHIRAVWPDCSLGALWLVNDATFLMDNEDSDQTARRHKLITKTCLYKVDPLKPHYIVKLGFTGIYIIGLISAQKHRLWVLVRTASAFLSRNMKNIRIFIWKFSIFLVVNFSVYLNRHVFIMNMVLRLAHVSEGTFSNVQGHIYWFQIAQSKI